MNRRVHDRNRLVVAAAAILAVVASLVANPPLARAERAGIGWNEGIAASSGARAKTVAELASLYDSASCRECHKEVHEQWSRTAHSFPLVGSGRTADDLLSYVRDGLSQWPFSGVKADGDVTVEHLMECAKCHLPQLADAEDGVAREIVALLRERRTAIDGKDEAGKGKAVAALNSLNIGCLICHNRNALIHKWTDGYPKAGEVYGKRSGSHPGPFATLRRSPVMEESILCGQCHGLGPNLELANANQCTTLYGSYIFAYRSHGGKESCQDCHMKRNRLGHDTRGFVDPSLIRSAVEVATRTHGFFWRDNKEDVPRVIVDVTMTNRAGHSIPDGISPNQRLVLTVVLSLPDGTELFSRSRAYMQFPQRMGRGNRMGRTAFEKTGVVEDTNLPPLETVAEKFDFVLDPVARVDGGSSRLKTELSVHVSLTQDPGDGGSGRPQVVLYDFVQPVTIEER